MSTSKRGTHDARSDAHRQLAHDLAVGATVLLRNPGGLLPLSPGTMKIRQILAEIRTTEAAYVATLRLLVKCQRALEGERLLGRAEAAEVFTSAETLMQVNSELLTRLPERPSSLEEIAHAFAAIAPCAAQFCATRRNFCAIRV